MSNTNTFEHKGHTFRIEIEQDEDMREPWEEHDGHGIVSDWTTRDKAPGERVLNADRTSKRYYDVQETIKRARADGWGTDEQALERVLGRKPTKREIIADAVERDFDSLTGMKVLVIFERSGRVRDAFSALGHDAWSCDIEPQETSGNHVQGDWRVAVHRQKWDLVIAHPECTHLAVSGAHRFKVKRADGRQQNAIRDFMAVAHIKVPRLCIENPISIMSSVWRKPDQIVQPHEFGDNASKKTCLWLRGLPKLVRDPALFVPGRLTADGKHRWANQTDSGQNMLGPSSTRAMDRARTYQGIADAMARQWTRD